MASERAGVSTISQVLLWFGAAVSIAEILTGALLAPLGVSQGLLAIVVGHLIGGLLLFLAGYIGASTGLSSSDGVRISFGRLGSYSFSILNVLQLLGWTAIMILSAAQAMDGIARELWGYENQRLWCLCVGTLILGWVALGNKGLEKLNRVIMGLLFLASLALGFVVIRQPQTATISTEIMGFGAAVELNVAMSLSWMPLIADYTRELKNPLGGTIGSVLGYFIGSILMYSIGLLAAIHTGTSDIAVILLRAGLGLVALFIVVLSTVTTTYLDVFSAGVCTRHIAPRLGEKLPAAVACVIGTALAIFASMAQYEDFLYLIGSVFAPLYAVLFVDYYLRGWQQIPKDNKAQLMNIAFWIVGFVCYRLLMPYDTPIGITLPVMMLIGLLCLCVSLRRRDGKWTFGSRP